MNWHTRYGPILIVLIILCSVLLFPPLTRYTQARTSENQRTVVGVESLGVVTFNTGFIFASTEVGGLSSITYDANRGVYYVLSDDQSQTNPARYYTVAIDLSDRHLDAGDVTFQDVTTLLDHHGAPFPELGIDPEGIVLAPAGTLYISSEGITNAEPPLPPFVNRFNLNGRQTKALPVPIKFLPNADRTRGVRNNAAFESLTVTPDRHTLYTATEHALAQDGPRAGMNQVSQSRILEYDRPSERPRREFVYLTEAGLVELAGLDNTGTLLALERSFTQGVGNTIKLFEARTQAATDVSGQDDLFDEDTETPASFVPVDKRLLANLADLGIKPDNVEGMALGPVLPDGRQILILVSDNNFRSSQVTQFIALALEIEVAAAQYTVIADGLDNPRGLAFGPRHALYVVEAGRGGGPDGLCTAGARGTVCYGPTGAVTRVGPVTSTNSTQERIVTGLPSLSDPTLGGRRASGPHDIAFVSQSTAAIVVGLGQNPLVRQALGEEAAGLGHLLHLSLRGRDAQVEPGADIAGYESIANPDAGAVDSNPYGVWSFPFGHLVADAGGNDLLVVSLTGDIATLAVFPTRPNPLPFGPPQFQAVPTSVTLGPDKTLYVGQLTGVPFIEGVAQVYRVVPDQEPEVVLTGFTHIIDLEFDHAGNLYVLQISSTSLIAGDTETGALIRVQPDGSRDTLAEGLIMPGGMAIAPQGDAVYITNCSVCVGEGEVVRVPLHD